MENNKSVPKYIDTLDGVRAIAITFVVWFHFWQQSWLTPCIIMPQWVNTYLGIRQINIEPFVRGGYIFVDLLILLSAVCNFYPYARSIALNEPWPDTKTFYKKRFMRIVPSYLLAVMIMFIMAVAENKYFNTGLMIKDIVAHLLFIKPFFKDLMMYSPINAVLWTVQVEMLYYILMPWLALLFKKRPYVMSIGMMLITCISVRVFFLFFRDNTFFNNNMFTYAAHYGCGMLVCMIYIELCQKSQNEKSDRFVKWVPVILIIGSIAMLYYMLTDMLNSSKYPVVQEPQMVLRFPMVLVFSVLVLSVMFLGKTGSKIMGNVVFRFISAISYNLYIWHQFIAVKLKEYHIPFWQGEQPPNMTGDKVWMWKYQILIVVLSILVAFVLTYFFEKPVAKGLRKVLIEKSSN